MSDDDNTLTLKACAFIELHIAEKEGDVLHFERVAEQHEKSLERARQLGQQRYIPGMERAIEYCKAQSMRAQDDTRVLNFLLERLLDQPPKYE